ncbi:hypothetical protein ACQPW1_18105 [Nocardia sp. CA-128927]|uniref:hypothetical protein n=1 Tax=Nocardia sp. CA-128927 TaxID=3239975 RepID=UPI003D987F95
MNRPDPSSPPTYDEALRIARDLAQNPDTLVPYAHQGLENARYGAGFAFLQTIGTDRGDLDGYVLVTTTAHGSGLLSAGKHTIDTVIAVHLARAEQSNRHIPDSELSVAHRVAVEAFDAGRTRVDEMPRRTPLDAETADYAEFVLIVLWRSRNEGDSGRNILARNDFLLRDPDPGRRYTHTCPRCERPAIYQARYPLGVCDHCLSRTTDRAGRRVRGFNTDLSGGMIAYYTDTLEHSDPSQKEECVEVTRTGVCFIDGLPAAMQEAHFGGIVVQMASAD